MKHLNSMRSKLFLVIVLALALALLSPVSFASEITGTFSSSGQSSTDKEPEPETENDDAEEEDVTENDEELSGSVSGNGGGNSKSSDALSPGPGERGSVLGASTGGPAPAENSTPARTGTGPREPVRTESLNESEEAEPQYSLPPIEENPDSRAFTLAIAQTDEKQSLGATAWLSFVSAVILGAAAYFYGNPRRQPSV